MPIRVLPSHLIDQIAAGEVIERPASVVKELIENALDAGARRLQIDIERGGLGLIRVRDDGGGIPREELPLAVLPHATSKIATAEDLLGIASLGFRGEALPSIGSVARLRLISRARDSAHAWELSVEAGERSAPQPAAHPMGTSVEVRDLFYGVPARRRFMRSESTEFGHILRQVERLALAVPTVGLELRHNERLILELPAAEGEGEEEKEGVALAARVDRILGPEFRHQALWLAPLGGPLRLTGWLGLPTAARGQPDQQYWFVNGRAVRDRLLASAVRLGYRDVLYHGRHPGFVLYLSLDPREVDVNAHPSKLELRFRDSRGVHDGVFRQIERALAATRPAAPAPEAPPTAASSLVTALQFSERAGPHPELPLMRSLPQVQGNLAALQALAVAEPAAAALEQPLGIALAQLHGLYILAQNRDGLIIVDAHAAHERVLYEQLKRDYEAAGAAASQGLLEPLILQSAEHELDALLEESAELERLGFSLERLSPASLAVRRVPVLLAEVDACELLQQLARELCGELGVHHLDATAHRLLGSLACRAAIRGQRMLSAAQMDALLRQMEQTERASQCNHGRPTWMRLSLREIDQLFFAGSLMPPSRPLLVVLTGPTGTGKSALALQLAERLAGTVPLEIVSMDSAQVYRGMDIGTAKPAPQVRAQLPHHLIDIRDPAESYSAGEFVRDALGAIAQIHARGGLPVLVGGTMLYLRALYHGLAALPAADGPLRRELEAQAQRQGWPALHAELWRVDPQAAARIAATDAQRIQRALEVWRLTGVPISVWQQRTQGARERFRWLRFALLPEESPAGRAALRERLAARLSGMLEAGLVQEVGRLHARGDLTPQHASMRAVGYRQLWPIFSAGVAPAEAQRSALTATMQLAKRQLTWLRREPELIRVNDRAAGLGEALSAQVFAAARA